MIAGNNEGAVHVAMATPLRGGAGHNLRLRSAKTVT